MRFDFNRDVADPFLSVHPRGKTVAFFLKICKYARTFLKKGGKEGWREERERRNEGFVVLTVW